MTATPRGPEAPGAGGAGDLAGAMVGRYRLQEVIGVGSFATVHRALDTRLDDVIVLKVLAENHSLSPEIRERFIAEGRALRRAAGAHVVAVHDMGETSRRQPYLVLEHADRGTLARTSASSVASSLRRLQGLRVLLRRPRWARRP